MPEDRQGNFFAPDGFRYGVMFNDGSVTDRWSGPTQRERAQDYAASVLIEQFAYAGRTDNITLCRRAAGTGEWERVLPPEWPENVPVNPNYL